MKKSKKILFIFLIILCSCMNILLLIGDIYFLFKFREFSTVTFNSNGGTVIESSIVKTGSTINLPKEPKKLGFEFLGWEIDGKMAYSPITVDKNIELVAKWQSVKVNTYAVRFYNEDGTLYSRQLVKENGVAFTPKKPIKSGYIFEYWTYSNGEKYDFSTKVVSDVELYAVFKERIIYDDEGIVDEGYDQEIVEE